MPERFCTGPVVQEERDPPPLVLLGGDQPVEPVVLGGSRSSR